MRGFGWLVQFWHRAEPAARLDWILETLGLRERAYQFAISALAGIVMLIFQKLNDAPIDWIILLVIGSIGLTFYTINQIVQLLDLRIARRSLREINPHAVPTVRFLNKQRIVAYVITAFITISALSLHRGPSGIEWPWFGGKSRPSPPTLPAQPSVSEAPPASSLSLGNNFYVSFSFPHPTGITGNEVEIELRFVNNEDHSILVENISVVELFGNDKEQYHKLDECYNPNVVDFNINNDNLSIGDSPIHGASAAKTLYLVSYKKSSKIMLNGTELTFPFTISSKLPINVIAIFEVSPKEKKRTDLNYFVVCPSIKFFDTRGQQSVSICPGLIEMAYSKEEYAADSYLIPRLIPRQDHIVTMGPSPEFGNQYRIFARRAGLFQLTPKTGTNSCQPVPSD